MKKIKWKAIKNVEQSVCSVNTRREMIVERILLLKDCDIGERGTGLYRWNVFEEW